MSDEEWAEECRKESELDTDSKAAESLGYKVFTNYLVYSDGEYLGDYFESEREAQMAAIAWAKENNEPGDWQEARDAADPDLRARCEAAGDASEVLP